MACIAHSNTGPFGAPPGGPWFANVVTGEIKNTHNPLEQFGLVQAGFLGYPTQAMANCAAHKSVAQVPKKVGALTGVNAIGDLAQRLTQSSTWIRVGEFIAGGLLLYLGLSATLRGTETGRAVQQTKRTVKRAAETAAVVAK